MIFPHFYEVRQHFEADSIPNVWTEVQKLFDAFDWHNRFEPGMTVAVGVASRGTHDLKDLVLASVSALKELGLKPYLTPAMGSHGGSTGEGQAQVLRDLGITEDITGCEIRASMDVTSLGFNQNGAEVLFAKDALAADRIMIINRVKPHTGFRAEVESGLCKIMAVGLGRRLGADLVHKHNPVHTIIPHTEVILEKAPVLCGLAVTENAYGGTQSIRLNAPEDFIDSDKQMLKEAWGLLPRLPIDELDVLIIDQMGKDISGTGMDPNVVGYWRRSGGDRIPDYRTIAVLDLTQASHGNAHGIGLADVTSQTLMQKVDVGATYTNARTARKLRYARFPVVRDTDKQALETAFDQVADPENCLAGRIQNTQGIEQFWLSRAALALLASKERISCSDEPMDLQFTTAGRLLPFSNGT